MCVNNENLRDFIRYVQGGYFEITKGLKVLSMVHLPEITTFWRLRQEDLSLKLVLAT
jgi:hypothetical protein